MSKFSIRLLQKVDLQNAIYVRIMGMHILEGQGIKLMIQGNIFGSCGIASVSGWLNTRQGKVEDVPELLEALKGFWDKAHHADVPVYLPKRFLIQTAGSSVSPFLTEVLKHCTHLSTYKNLAHTSSEQNLYMLSFED